MKGIILAGGKGTRLFPITKAVSKQLLPIYDKPMIYYPLSVLMLANIREILIISNPKYITFYENLFRDGKELGLTISYEIQERPKGLADAFNVGRDFIDNDSVALVLGDNVFYGTGFSPILEEASKISKGAMIFGYYVKNPREFGIVEFDENKEVITLEEKPKYPKSNYAIPGLYFYDRYVTKYVQDIKPSSRGELEITDLNKIYLYKGQLKIQVLGRGFAWLDTGTYSGLADAGEFVRTIQNRTGLYVGCIEEVAYNKGFIDKNQLRKLGKKLYKTEYGKYILRIAGVDK